MERMRTADKAVTVALGAAAVYLFFEYLWGAVLPFVIGYALAECFKPVVKYAEKHEKFPKRAFVLAVLTVAAGALAMLIFAALRELVHELQGLLSTATDFLTRLRDDDGFAAGMIDKICSALPFGGLREKLWELRPELDGRLLDMIAASADKIAAAAIGFAGGAMVFLPEALLTAAVVLISAYYFAVDRVKVNCFFLSLFPQSARPKLKRLKDGIAGSVVKYLRAYTLIFIITFAQLFIAFLLMGLDYAFIIALATAIVDILPVVGTGTVLLPWAAGSMICGEYGTGIALLATYAVITVVRQIIEPKIVGRFIGLPPLAALAAMFLGLKLMGLAGLILFPLAAIALLKLYDDKEKQKD